MAPMTLGEKIKQLRQEKGYSQTFLEKRSWVNSKLLSKYRPGKKSEKLIGFWTF